MKLKNPDPQKPAFERMITLVTDFGTADGYVGAMKGRILTLAPHANIVDISHEIEPQNVVQGAWCLRRVVPQFPQGTIHLAVVDPGVGSERAAVVVAIGQTYLIGPDNGLLTLAVADASGQEDIAIWEIEEAPPERARSVSFDGLSLFAPTAAQLMLGASPENLGRARNDLAPLQQPGAQPSEDGIDGEILFFDRFGNGVTNIPKELVAGRDFVVRLPSGGRLHHFSHYAAMTETKEPVGLSGAVWNSDGLLELATFASSFQKRSALAVGSQIVVEWV